MASRTIIVTRTWTIRTGEKNGKQWTLYGVEATSEQGEPIAYELKTFSKLPHGQVQVELERQEHEQYGTSFMLKPVGGAGGGGAGALADAELRAQIARLESRVSALESGGPSPPAAMTPGLPDDDIPF